MLRQSAISHLLIPHDGRDEANIEMQDKVMQQVTRLHIALPLVTQIETSRVASYVQRIYNLESRNLANLEIFLLHQRKKKTAFRSHVS